MEYNEEGEMVVALCDALMDCLNFDSFKLEYLVIF